MDRRDFIRGLLAAPAAVMAAKLGAPVEMADEIREELQKDLLRESVGFSDATIFDNRPVWKSLGAIRSVYAEEMARQLGRAVDDQIQKAARAMVSEMDTKLARAEVPEDQKVILEMPKLIKTFRDHTGNVQGTFASGVEQKTGLFGINEIRVGWIAPQKSAIVDVYGRDIA